MNVEAVRGFVRLGRGGWHRRLLLALLVLLAVVGVLVGVLFRFPSLLRTGSREAVAKVGRVDPLSEVCRGDVVEGYCASPAEIARDLRSRPFEVLDAQITAEGVTKPQRLRSRVRREGSQGVVYHVKWKPVPKQLDVSNNSPRRELASYELQRLLFAPEHHVVVPTVLRCLSPEMLEKLGNVALFPGAECALGVLAFWLEEAYEFDRVLLEEARPELARRIGDLNVFTIFAGHRDAIGANFLVVGRPPVRVFAVDSGMTFGAWSLNPLGLVGGQWTGWRANSVSPSTLERLRRLRRGDLDVLNVVAQLDFDPATHQYRSVTPSAPRGRERAVPGVRWYGKSIQFGLVDEEIDDAFERVQTLLDEL